MSISLRAAGEGLVWLIGAVVCLCAAPQVHLFVSAGNGWPCDALRYHWLLPISCHFQDCKSSSGHESDSCKQRYSNLTSTRPFTFHCAVAQYRCLWQHLYGCLWCAIESAHVWRQEASTTCRSAARLRECAHVKIMFKDRIVMSKSYCLGFDNLLGWIALSFSVSMSFSNRKSCRNLPQQTI